MRPYVTLSYAQSLDGCISARPDQPTTLSGTRAMKMTHTLRAQHDAILVGIGTVLADNPRLSVRLVAGEHPQPIVLDSHLKIPLDSHLIKSPVRPLWVFCNITACNNAAQRLADAGVIVHRVVEKSTGQLNLAEILNIIAQLGIRSLMVEGGSKIIQSFLQDKLVNHVVITVAPKILSGLPAITNVTSPPTLLNIKHEILDQDIIFTADTIWK
jgi:3,4-dihydroxy 2-butanone 4-phosphate synthase/GTP cyclohydrolase II